MAWTSNIDKAELGSQGGKGNPLLLGKFDYEIATATEVVDKKDPTGKTKQVVFDFKRNGNIHKVWFSPESDNDIVAKIAADQIGAIGKAAGLKGVMKPERLKLLVGKSVELDCYENKKGYVTIGGINVASEESTEEEEAEEQEEEEEEEEEETTEAAPATSGKKKNPWD